MAQTRIRYVAEFDYPGMFMPETTSRECDAGTLEAALAVAPNEDSDTSYFVKDGWYAVEVFALHEKLYTSGDDTKWLLEGQRQRIRRWVVGVAVKADDMIPTDSNRILIANLRGNSPTATGIRCRPGNWQPMMEYDCVLDPDTLAVRT